MSGKTDPSGSPAMLTQRFFSNLKGDLAGASAASLVSLTIGMTVGVIAFAPLGKDYAVQGVLAGIYGGVVLGIVAALFGGRSVMLSGPRAASALIIALLMTNLIASEDLLFPSGQTVPSVIAITFFAMFLAGCIQFFAGRTQIATIVKNIPQPVAAGFMNSAALIVIIKQCWVLLDIPRRETFLEYAEHIGEARPLTFIPGAVAMAAMYLSKKWLPKLPSPIAGLLAGTSVYYAMQTALKGADVGATLGKVTTRFPIIQIPEMFSSLTAGGDLTAVLMLVIPAALSLAALSSLESTLTLSDLDELTGGRTDSNREIAGQGLGNMASALIGGITGAGAMIRTKPGYDAGGRTPAMGIFVSLIMLAIVLGGADLIQFIPRAVIAGMILMIGVQLFDKWSFGVYKRFLAGSPSERHASLLDTFIITLVVTVALSFDLMMSVGVGIVVSVIVFVTRMSHSVVRREYSGPAMHSRSMWSERRQAQLAECTGKLVVLQLEGAIFFGTAEGLEEHIHKLSQNGINHIILDMKRVKYIDTTGTFVLQRIHRLLDKTGGVLTLSYILPERRRQSQNFTGPDRRSSLALRQVWKSLESSGTVDLLGKQAFYADTDSALAFCENRILAATANARGFDTNDRKTPPAILNGMSRDEIRKIRRLFTRISYPAGGTIFQQGDAGNALYYISRGRADVYVNVGGGYFKRLQALQRGAVFGEMALLDNQPRAAGVIADLNTICYQISTEDFEKLKATDQEITIKLLNNLCIMFSQRVRSSNKMIVEMEK